MKQAERDARQRRIHQALHAGELADCTDERCRKLGEADRRLLRYMDTEFAEEVARVQYLDGGE